MDEKTRREILEIMEENPNVLGWIEIDLSPAEAEVLLEEIERRRATEAA